MPIKPASDSYFKDKELKGPSDPIIKERIKVVNTNPATKWTTLIGIFVLIGSLGVGAISYFFPESFQKMAQFGGTTPVESASLPPNNTTASPSPVMSTGPETSIKASQESISTAQMSSPSETAVVSPEQVTQPPKLTASLPQPPITEPVNRVSALAKSPVTTVPEGEIKKAETTSAPELKTQTSKQVKRLLAKAETQIDKLRLTSPQGDNAYESYQALAKIAPQQAQQVLDSIVNWYFQRGEKYIAQGKLTQPKRRSAYAMYKKISEIAPEHQDTQTLFNRIFDTLKQRAQWQIENNGLIAPKDNNAYSTYQKMMTIAPDTKDTQGLLKTIIDGLLARAKEQMAKKNYTTPDNDNAAYTYKQILKISENNAQALKGINKIVKEYYKWARIRRDQGRYKGSMDWIKRGLLVDPDNQELNELRLEVREKMR
jgi:tetratricopeptide (TPR) repeat protein